MVEMNEARYHSALNYQHSVDSAIRRSRFKLVWLTVAAENQKRIDEATDAADNAVSKVKSLYKAGLVDYLSVLDAQRQQKMMQDQVASLNYKRPIPIIAVYKSLGGGWKVVNETQSVEAASVN